MSDQRQDIGRVVTLVIGVVLLVMGLSALVSGDLFAWSRPFAQVWSVARWASRGLALVVIGIAVLYFANRGQAPRLPGKGQRLYRSPDDKMISGLVGGLARYLGVDSTVLRLVTVGLALVNPTGVLLAYVIAAALVPVAPPDGQAPTAPGQSPPPPPGPQQ